MVTEGRFTDPESGALIDPATVQFKTQDPNGVEAVLSYPHANLTKTSTGVYVAHVDLTAGGAWDFEWVCAGDYKGAEPFRRYVKASEFT